MSDNANTSVEYPDTYGNALIPEKGDPTEATVYAAVGYALSKWEAMEAEMCWLYGALRGLPRYASEAIVGYSQKPTLRGRIEQVREYLTKISRNQPNQALEGGILALTLEVETLATTRNKIAHAVVVLLRQKRHKVLPGTMTNRPYDQEYCLVPAYYNHRYVDSNIRPNYIYLAEEIRRFGGQFEQLHVKIAGLIRAYFPPPPHDA